MIQAGQLELDPSQKMGDMQGLFPYIVRDRLRIMLPDGRYRISDDVVEFQNPQLHTAGHLKQIARSGIWEVYGYEEAALSPSGAFPSSLQIYSDGFLLLIPDKLAYGHFLKIRDVHSYGASGEELTFEQTQAIKDILWSSRAVEIDYIPEAEAVSCHDFAHMGVSPYDC